MDKYKVYLYSDARGRSFLEDFTNKATKQQKSKIARLIVYLKSNGINRSNPALKKLVGMSAWELRSLGGDNLRIYCTPHEEGIALIHITIKKSQKINTKDMEIIRKRLKELKQ